MDKKYIDYSSYLACEFWKNKTNKFILLSDAIDLKDMKQEANICAWGIIEQFPHVNDEGLLKHYIKKGINWHFKNIKRSIIKKRCLIKNNDKKKFVTFISLDEALNIQIENSNIDFNFILKDIKNILSNREWKIFYLKVIEKRTFEEIAHYFSSLFKRKYLNTKHDKNKYTAQYMKKIYQNGFKKIKKKFKKEV